MVPGSVGRTLMLDQGDALQHKGLVRSGPFGLRRCPDAGVSPRLRQEARNVSDC
jgi:hypothetical protein